MAELTPFGFQRRSRIEILEENYQRLRELFGADILLTEDSVFGKLAAMWSEFQVDNERVLEEVYENRKVSSAEGIYLDDILNRYGFYRRGPVAGSGRAAVRYSPLAPLNTEITPISNFSGTNGKIYNPITTTNIFNAFSGMTLTTTEVQVGDYEVQIVNESTGNTETLNHTVAGSDLIFKRGYLEALETFIKANTSGNNLIIFIADNTPSFGVSTLFVGYNSSQRYIGLNSPVSFVMNPRVGSWWSEVAVRCSEEGFAPLPAEGITGYTPSFTGLLGASNGRPFSPGDEAEPDAEFFQRWAASPEQAPLGTRDSVVRALLSVEGVSKVRIYDNPSIDNTAEADALSFKSIVVGGIDSEVAQAIYLTKPINAGTSGDLLEEVDTLDGSKEPIRFSRAVDNAISIRISYSPRNGVLLNSIEEEAIKESLIALVNNTTIGDTLFNSDAEAEVYASLSNRRLKALTVNFKLESEDPSEFFDGDLSQDFDDVFSVEGSEITFVGSL
jgi:hypothetical protein